ncbi:MAG: dihydrolipoyl dehydrogenase [Dehalococcoidia bacterium]
MKDYDFIVVGSGCGLIIVDEAVEHDLKVALVDVGPLGGTCLNVGCIPSKMLTAVADRVVDIQEARKLGVRGKVTSINFQAVMQRMQKVVGDGREHVRKTIAKQKKLDFYEGKGSFVDDMTMEINSERIKGKRIFLASGSRTLIPPIKGLETVDYLTNESVLNLKNRPESMVIIGGGYIAVELGHFFAAMGTRVTILEMADRLILSEEPEIAELLKERLSSRMQVRTGELVQEVRRDVSGKGTVVLTQLKATGEQKEYSAERILLAVGRRSNADMLQVEKTGVQLDQRGFIKVNGYMQTSHRYIFAVGDANGQQMFTHIANREAVLAADHVLHGTREKMDYSAAPHAVYSYPQIASVGMTEEQARREHKVRVGKTKYRSVAYGEALLEKRGFAKAVIEEETDKILGFHIIGPYAPVLIQEVINAMQSKGNVYEIFKSMHIHPAMTELIPTTLVNT